MAASLHITIQKKAVEDKLIVNYTGGQVVVK